MGRSIQAGWGDPGRNDAGALTEQKGRRERRAGLARSRERVWGIHAGFYPGE